MCIASGTNGSSTARFSSPGSGDTHETMARRFRSIRVGIASARANVLPAVVLWTIAGALVVAYYGCAAVPEALAPFSRRLVVSGWIAPFLNRVLFCGVVPGLFLVFVPSLRPHHVGRVIVLEMLWNGALGVAGDWCFHLLNRLFGEGHDVLTLLLKTAVDQFVWTVVFIAPVNAVFHFWLARDCSFAAVRRDWTKRFYSALVAPNLISNWCVWIPVQLATFTFPVDLQIHVNGIICAFWTLMCLQIGKRTGVR